ncbi:MAG: hypothetical protein ACE37F_13050 [Nannocystaceae bacterium]|nr:hypothetical protein [bacterium]
MRTTEFYVEAMARPGLYPDAFCCACDFCYAEGVVPDERRAQAIEDLRREQIEHSDVSVKLRLLSRSRRGL